MNRHNVRGCLIEITGMLKQVFAKLKKDEFLYMEGVEEELLGNLQKRLGRTKKEIHRLNEKAY